MNRTLLSERTGRGVLSAAAAATIVGGVAANWNRTHLFNPKWPPHAKFHDAMTIMLGVLLGATGLIFLWSRRRPSRQDLALGALLPGFIYAAQAASFAFPGTGGLDAEFPEKVPRVAGIRLNEKPFSLAMLALLAAGYAMGRRAAPPLHAQPESSRDAGAALSAERNRRQRWPAISERRS